MINHIIDHALTTIGCTLDGMEVETVSAEAVGYLLINCIASIRTECESIKKEASKLK